MTTNSIFMVKVIVKVKLKVIGRGTMYKKGTCNIWTNGCHTNRTVDIDGCPLGLMLSYNCHR